MPSKSDSTSKKIPLRWKLKAWWKGYDIADIEAKMRLQGQKEEKPQKPEADANRALWNKERVEVSQLIWGDGFCGPGGPENVIAMSKLLALSPKISAMVIGAGLGGPSRVLAQQFGVWISGYECNELLAEEGMKMSVTKGLQKKAPIIHCDLNKHPEFGRQFDRAFSKEALFTIENKAALINSIYDHLKDESLFLISDYVVKSHESLAHPDVIDWIQHEPTIPFPVTSETLKFTLEKVGFTIRIHEDITDHYLSLINDAWANADRLVMSLETDDGSNQKKMVAIMKEAELWNRRTKIMRSGELKVFRYLAHKAAATIVADA